MESRISSATSERGPGRAGAILALGLVAGCAGRPALPGGPTLPESVELTATPFYAQTDHQCGPAALATMLGAAGLAVTPAELSDAVYLPEKRGSLQIELMAATRRHGRIAYPIGREIDAILAQLAAGRPVLVLQNLGVRSWPIWHYAVVVGFDRREDEIVLRSGETKRRVLPARRFLRTWTWADGWGLVALRPGELPPAGDPGVYLKALAEAEAHLSAADRHRGYTVALAAWPDEPVALLGLGNASYALGDLEEAEGLYRHLSALQPENAIARNNLAQVLAETGRVAQAREEIRLALQHAAAGSSLHATLRRTQADIEALARP